VRQHNIFKYSQVAQNYENVDMVTENRSVGGSIPPLGTIKINHLAIISQFKKSGVSALCPH
jgi:hypothetical protein